MRNATVRFVSILVLLVCALAGAMSLDASPLRASTAQSWICGWEYQNHARANHRHGVVLAGDGRMWRHDFSSYIVNSQTSWKAADFKSISEDELKLRYEGAIDTGKRISGDDISRHVALIGEAAKMPLHDAGMNGADMGVRTLYCLARNISLGTYFEVRIRQNGDINRANPSPEAKALEVWLESIFKKAAPDDIGKWGNPAD